MSPAAQATRSGPHSSWSPRSGASFRSPSTTLAPDSKACRAIAAPMPPAAPVTTTTESVRLRAGAGMENSKTRGGSWRAGVGELGSEYLTLDGDPDERHRRLPLCVGLRVDGVLTGGGGS